MFFILKSFVFIVIVPDGLVDTILNLKSNMDRFIGRMVFEYAMSNEI